ncbi:unnamed protein product [Rotaria sordida]|uniref:Uncharacterized protein n=1 Tax=Rotaria sordida TaxID=392033 RepID=A0A813QX09_9BILA|nr:unnamed protein product [Rotaria sordida]CAF1268968.1 unnamed protein product [Rotaria sordida]
MCRVDSTSWKAYSCKTRYSRYTCYGAVWEVHYEENRTTFAIVEEEKRFRSYSDAFKRAQEYQIDSSYSCWYDTRNPSVAQWNKPSTVVAIILLSCGGLSVLLIGIFSFIAIRLIKQEVLQQRQDNIDPYFNPDFAIKQ